MTDNPSGTTFHPCPNNIYHQLLDIIQMVFTDQQYQYLFIQLKTYHLNDAQWNGFKSTMNSYTISFTDNQWIQVQNFLSHDRLNDGQFNIFTDLIDTSRQKLVLLHAGGGTGKHLLHAKFLKNYSCVVKFVAVLVQQESVHLIYHKDVHFRASSRHGHQI